MTTQTNNKKKKLIAFYKEMRKRLNEDMDISKLQIGVKQK